MKQEKRNEAMELLAKDLLVIRDMMTDATKGDTPLDRTELWRIADLISASAQYAARIVSDDVTSSSVVVMIGESHPSLA